MATVSSTVVRVVSVTDECLSIKEGASFTFVKGEEAESLSGCTEL